MRLVFDIEANGLLDETTIDYTTSPYKLKDSFIVHCVVAKDIDTGEVYTFVQDEVKTKLTPLLNKASLLVGHNFINYDLLALKLYLGLDYNIVGNYSFNGKAVDFCDTMIMSKTLNPDRHFGHSVDAWGKFLGLEKIEWREKAIELGLISRDAPQGAEFAIYHPEMLTYCIRDVDVTHKIYSHLLKEWGDWNWDDAFKLEQQVADIITRQSHRGFKFNKEKALENVRELDKRMDEIRNLVEPIIPPKPLTKTKLKEFTPPKTQFLKSGEPNTHIKNFAKKHNGEVLFSEAEQTWQISLLGDIHNLPLPPEPLVTAEPAKLSSSASDSSHIKSWLVEEFNWKPSNYKERDLTTNSKKQKLSKEKFEESVERYVEQTLNSVFCKDRCDELETTPKRLREKLLKHDVKRPLKVYTNPTLTVGLEKEIDPNLLEIADKFPHAKAVSDYFSYTHRRNSIIGGGVDPDSDEDEEIEKGFLSVGRIDIDGRIPTPAGTCDAASSRMRHKLVANISRVTSTFGKEMRSMFCSDTENGMLQLAYDFSGLEARIESHYCWKWDEDKVYCNSLIQEKPNDVHTLTAAKISDVLGRPFDRTPAKSVKYCVPMDTKALTKKGWKSYNEIKVGDYVLGFNQESGLKEWTEITDKVFFDEAEVYEFGNKWTKYKATAEHRWFVKQRKEFATKTPSKPERKYVTEVRLTKELNTESSIIINAPFNNSQDTASTNSFSVIDSKYNVSWVSRVLDMSQAERVAFLEGFLIADGHYNLEHGKWYWAQFEGELFEAALLASYLVQDGVVQVRTSVENGKNFKVVTFGKTPTRGLQTSKTKLISKEPVWCITTKLGSWVMRQGDSITITGNCCAYGGQPKRVAKTIGCEVEDGAKVYNAYWDSAKPLATLREKLKRYWETTGQKKFVLGLDGRKIPIRSQSALINFLFQCAGVICAKRTMVEHELLLRDEGLLVDFFKDDWKNKKFCQQMIAYHDEAQLEIHRSLVEFRKFASEDEAKDFTSDDGRVWSEVIHTDKGYFRAYCKAGELISKAVNKTNEYYKLNIPLAAEYVVGTGWHNCH